LSQASRVLWSTGQTSAAPPFSEAAMMYYEVFV
jgi:hypothetical protein